MKIKSIGLLSLAITCVTALGLTISSCDNNSNAPTTPGNGGVDRSKDPQVLDGPCTASTSITNCPTGQAAVSYNADGDEVFTGLTAAGAPNAGTVNCTFGSPANVWRGSTDITFAASGGSLTYESKDAGGNVEASVTLASAGPNYTVLPTFTSAPGAGTALYDAYILDNNNNVIGSQLAIAATTPVTITPAQTCVINVTSIGWDVYQVNAQCAWRIGFNPCCTYSFRLPNGTIIPGNKIKLVERNSNGVYVYTQTSTITTSGTVATYNLKAASAYTHN